MASPSETANSAAAVSGAAPRLGTTVIGIGTVGLGFVTTVPAATAATAAIGIGTAYLGIVLIA